MSDELYKYLKIERDEEEDRKEIEKIDRLLFLGLMFILLVVPLVIRVHIVDYISPLITDEQILDTGKRGDIFTYYKSRLLIISTVMLSLLFVYKVAVLKYPIPKTKLNISLAVLATLVTLSAIFAPYKTLALYGMYNRNEGTITYLCYLMLFFIAANIRYTQKRLRWTVYCLYPFVLINALLGIVNFYGYNVLELEWVKKLLYSDLPEGVSLNDNSYIVGTVNNPNYVSGIAAFLVVFFSWLAISENQFLVRGVHSLFATLSFAMLLASLSSSGFVTLVLLSPCIAYLLFRQVNKRDKIFVFLVLLFLFVSVYVPFLKHDSRVWDETIGFFLPYNLFNQEAIQKIESNQILDDVRNTVNNIAGQIIAGTSVYADEQEYEIPQLPEAQLSFGSGRVFIWEKALELIMKRPLMGYGLDTFPYFFNQDDVDKYKGLGGSYQVIVDKPHNMYIGIAFGAGILSLLALLLLFVSWGLQVSRSFSNIYVVGMFLGVVAYLVQGLFNDSIIGTAVFFWIFSGIVVGIARDNAIDTL